MNTTEINGYEIETFNQYDLAVGKKEGICPVCSHDRKPENRKAKCAMYDWERGLGTCMNCDTVFQLHTFKRKGGGTSPVTAFKQSNLSIPCHVTALPGLLTNSPSERW